MGRELPPNLNPDNQEIMPPVSVASSVAKQVATAGRRTIPEVALVREKRIWKEEELVPSGSTMINLACTDTYYGAYQLGGFCTVPGESAAGKTVLALTTLAECTYLPRFDDYLLIHDDAEERMAFDIRYLFSARVANRIQRPPLGNSKTIQAFEANMMTLQKQKKKFIYVLDSLDSLASSEEIVKEMARAMALAKSEEAAKAIAGSYGMEKAKLMGQTLRMTNNYLKESLSLCIATQQLRQNIDGGPFEPEYVTSGGEAPFYYSNHVIWMMRGGQHKDKGLIIGGHTRAKVEKNSATGKRRLVEFDIFNDMGVDDIGSIVDWMTDDDHPYWKKCQRDNKTGWLAEDLGLFEPTKNKLIAAIENNGLELEARKAVHRVWNELENSVLLDRKRRYT